MIVWSNVYDYFNPVAFNIFSLPIHWYGIMYVTALIVALYIGKYFLKKEDIGVSDNQFDIYFIYVEVGVILGARLGFILFYDTNASYYLYAPWEIFNPFVNGEFVGISGMSYHGAVFGFAISSYIFAKRNKVDIGKLMDLVAISVPLGFVFGRIGNFLNQELIGRVTDVSWGIYVDGVLRHPSQLYEAFLEGVVVFIILFLYRKYKRFSGELAIIYVISYGILRSIAEIYRAPDIQIGYVCCEFITQGQVMSLGFSIISLVLWVYLNSKKKSFK